MHEITATLSPYITELLTAIGTGIVLGVVRKIELRRMRKKAEKSVPETDSSETVCNDKHCTCDKN